MYTGIVCNVSLFLQIVKIIRDVLFVVILKTFVELLNVKTSPKAMCFLQHKYHVNICENKNKSYHL